MKDNTESDRTRNYRRGQAPSQLEVKATLAQCVTRNRQGAELCYALLSIPHERPTAWEAQHVIALRDALVAIHTTLTGHRPEFDDVDDDGGGEFRG